MKPAQLQHPHPARPWRKHKFCAYLDEVFDKILTAYAEERMTRNIPYDKNHGGLDHITFNWLCAMYRPSYIGDPCNFARFCLHLQGMQHLTEQFPDLSLDALKVLASAKHPDARCLEFLELTLQGITQEELENKK